MTDKVIKIVLDRWEEDKGVLEGFGAVPRALLPSDAKEGDVLRVTVGPTSTTWSLDEDARREREREIERLRDSLTRPEDDGDDIINL